MESDCEVRRVWFVKRGEKCKNKHIVAQKGASVALYREY